MGNVLLLVDGGAGLSLLTLRDEFRRYSSSWSLRDAKRAMSRFEQQQKSFGWGMQKDVFARLFGGVPADEIDAEWSLWDSDRNGIADVLEIVSGITMVARAKFENKIKALFNLFDFDSNKRIKVSEMLIMVRTCWAALMKMTVVRQDADISDEEKWRYEAMEQHLESLRKIPVKQLEDIAASAFKNADQNNDKRLTRAEAVKWAYNTAVVVYTIGQFGTSDADQTKKKHLVLLRASRKSARRNKSKLETGQKRRSVNQSASHRMSRRSEGKSSHAKSSKLAHGAPTAVVHYKALSEMTEDEIVKQLASLHNLEEVKQAKVVFDRMDHDHTGSIDARELGESLKQNPYLYNTTAVFEHLDVDHSGEISFEELLHFLFPYAKDHEYKLMAEAVNVPNVESEDIKRISNIFVALDNDFDGLVEFGQLVKELRREGGKFALWIIHLRLACNDSNVNADSDSGASAASTSASASASASVSSLPPDHARVGLREFLHEVFRRNYSDKIKWILQEAVPVRVLTYDEQDELRRLFTSIDLDGDNVITLNELKDHVAKMGLSEDECDDLFDMFDTSGDSRISMQEFMCFYRNVWNTSTSFDSTTGDWKLPDTG